MGIPEDMGNPEDWRQDLTTPHSWCTVRNPRIRPGLPRQPDPRRRVALAYELVFSRLPDHAEIDEALELVDAIGWSAFAWALFNASEFLLIP